MNLDLHEAEIARRLSSTLNSAASLQEPPYIESIRMMAGDPRPAAVLIPFLKREDSWHLLYTRRNPGLAEHSGQVSFPGGRMDSNDYSAEQTALREAREEIGLEANDVHLLGKLRQFLTITNYLVTPVVGVMPWPYDLRLSREEVSRAFTIPLAWLADPANYEEKLRILPPPFSPIPVVFFKPYDGEVLWGASARITLHLLDSLQQNGTATS